MGFLNSPTLTVFLGEHPVERQGLFNPAAQVLLPELKVEPARLDLRYAQQVVNQLEHELSAGVDAADEVVFLLVGKLPRLIVEQVRTCGSDLAQRVAQVVRRHAEQLVLHVVEFDQLGVLRRYLGLGELPLGDVADDADAVPLVANLDC